jgi:hypothetical protein
MSDGLEVYPVPFDPHVAWVAEGHQVIQRVRFIRILKRADRPDVMHIGSPLRLRPTTTTNVAVSASGCPSHSSPIRPVVTRMPASPRGVVRPFSIGVAANQRAEGHPTLPMSPIVRAVEWDAAIQTDPHVPHTLALWLLSRLNQTLLGFLRVLIGFGHYPLGEAERPTIVVASLGAKGGVLDSLYLRGTFGVGGTTSKTRQGDFTSAGISSKNIGASTTTCKLSTVLNPLGISLVGFLTNRTCPGHAWTGL